MTATRFREPLKSMLDAVSQPTVNDATQPTPDPEYVGGTFDEGVQAMLADLNASGTHAVFHRFYAGPEAGFRSILSAILGGAEDETAKEDLYLVQPQQILGTASVVLEPLLVDVTWTASATSVSTSAGAPPGYRYPDEVAATNTGLAEVRSGVDVEFFGTAAAPRVPASITIRDPGEAMGVLRAMWKGTASSWIPMGRRWR